ncbi:MAG: endonuclease [Candidatus Sulfotelmatobacter sp.]|nr:endonuclease [Candidatus Sulfotelmatobacter sp.]
MRNKTTKLARHFKVSRKSPKRRPKPTAANPKKKLSLPASPYLDAKQRGELVEMMFMVQASRRGLIVAKPYGDSRRYDFITDAGKRLRRVQVKSSTCRAGRGYRINASARRHSRATYTAADIDFLIGYVIPRNAWYVVPVAELRSTTFLVYPDGCKRGGLYEQFREAWHFLGAELHCGADFGMSASRRQSVDRDLDH